MTAAGLITLMKDIIVFIFFYKVIKDLKYTYFYISLNNLLIIKPVEKMKRRVQKGKNHHVVPNIRLASKFTNN